MKQKIILLCVLVLGIISFFILKPSNKVIKNNPSPSENTGGMISVLVDGVEQSAFPSKGSAEYQSTSCTNGETAVWDATNWKLSIQDISASTRCVVSFVTGGHNVYVSVSGGTVDSAPKNVAHNGNVTFTVAASNSNYVFSSAKCSGANGYSWANNVLSVNGVVSDAYCDVVFSRPTYTVYFNVVGGYTEDNYLTVVRGGGNSTTFGAVPGYLVSGSKITCDTGITAKITGTRVVLSNVLASGDCTITCAKDSSSYLPGGAVYNVGDEVSYANLAWLVVGSDSETVTLILKANATYEGTSSSNTTGTGIFGSGVTYTSSSARSYLVDIWLEQDAQKYLRTAIESEGLAYQDDANGFIRLPYISEVNTKLPNGSGTNFWTMDNDGNGHVYYGQPDGYGNEGKASDGKWYYTHYTLATNTSVKYSWSSTLKTYASTTCGASGNTSTSTSGTAPYMYRTRYYSSNYRYYTARYCNKSSGSAWIPFGSSTLGTASTHYDSFGTSSSIYVKSAVSCAGYGYRYCYHTAEHSNTTTCSGTLNTYDGADYSSWGCESTCAQLSGTITLSVTVNPYSGTNSYAGGQYSAGYKKWVANVGTEKTSTTGTKNTALTYTATTDGNNDLTTAIQAVLPTSTSARTNDSVPTETGNQTLTGKGTYSLGGTYYRGYGSTCDSIKLTSITQSTAASNSVPTKTYMRYTLKNHNSSTMGYRPVIVVYKAN